MKHSPKRAITGFALVLAGVIALPIGAASALDSAKLESGSGQLIARKGGGGSSGRKGGGGSSARKASGHSGFSNAGGGFNRGSTKPSGGWSKDAKVGKGSGGPSLSRPASTNRKATASPKDSRNRDGKRDLNRDGNRDISRNVNRDVNRDVNRNVNRNISRNWNRNFNRINPYPGWARPGWGVARPWNHGWYGGWNNPPWGWWGARAATWGVASLATAAIINDAVNDAIDDHNAYIMVPNTNYELLYGTVQPSSSDSVTFVIQADSNEYQLNANCNSGTLNGQDPSNAEEAQLLNAACQVAYGSA